LSRPTANLFTLEVDENQLRRSMLPREVVLPDGRKGDLQKVKISHFSRVKGMRAN
jgi:hypothetical protein